MSPQRQKSILNAVIQNLFDHTDAGTTNTDPHKTAGDVVEFIRSLPWYMQAACSFFLLILEYLYPFWAHELKCFSRVAPGERQKKYLEFWCRQRFYSVNVLFKIIFALSALTTFSQPQILIRLGYDKDLAKKLHYDHRRCTD